MTDRFYELLEEYRDARRNAFVEAFMINNSGKHIAGIYNVNVPREILWAMDIIPVNIFSIDDSNVKEAENVLDKDTCSLIKASYGYYITDKCPLTHFSDLIVATDMCPEKLNMIKKLSDRKKIYILKEKKKADELIPEMRNFVSFLEREFDVEMNEEKLVSVIKMSNAVNKKMMELIMLYCSNKAAISCDDLFSIIFGNQFILNLNERLEKLSEVVEIIKKIDNSFETSKRKSVLINGAPIAGIKEKLLGALSASDVTVLFSAPFCEGESLMLVDEQQDIYRALSEKYKSLEYFGKYYVMNELQNYDASINVRFEGCNHTEFSDNSYKENIFIETSYSEKDADEILKKINLFIKDIQ